MLKPIPDTVDLRSWSKSFLPQSGDHFKPDRERSPARAGEIRQQGSRAEVGRDAPRIDVTLAAYVLDRTNTARIR